jgi:hypothetical protein
MIKHPQLPVAVHVWDWKAQPNWSAIQEMLAQLQNETGRKIQIIEVEDTGCDENAVVLCDESLTTKEARHYYDVHLEWEENIDPDSLDWDGVKGILKVRLGIVWDSPFINLQRKQCFALLNRFVSGERSSNLFDEVQAMAKGHVSSKFLNT